MKPLIKIDSTGTIKRLPGSGHLQPLADPTGEGQSGHGPHHGFREGSALPLPRQQKELLKVGGS